MQDQRSQSDGKNNQITFELPYPPTLNDYFHVNLYGSLYVSKRGKNYRKNVILLVKKYALALLKIDKPVELIIDVFPPDRRRRDVDNVLKCLLDALQDSGIIQNDYQIYKLTITRKDELLNKVWIKIIY